MSNNNCSADTHSDSQDNLGSTAIMTAVTPSETLLKVAREVVWLPPSATRLGIVAKWLPDSGSEICRIDTFAADILRLADGTRNTETIAEDLKVEAQSVNNEILKLEESIPRLFARGGTDRTKHSKQQQQLDVAKKMQRVWEAANWSVDSNARFHETGIPDAHSQFDEIETTVSHLFREPHRALGGRRYGEAFCDWLLDRGMITTGANIMEIGCGVGYFASHVLNRLQHRDPGLYDSISYTMFDLSPELQRSQQEQCANHALKIEFQSGNAEEFDFGQQRFDLIISNEVIADFSVTPVRPSNVSKGTPETETEQLAVDYGLDCTPPFQGYSARVAINSGAIRLVEKLNTILIPGGHAVLTEYGTVDQLPNAVSFGDHLEFTVHFGHLKKVAEALEMETRLENLGDLLQFDRDFQILDLRTQNSLAKALMPELGYEELPTLAYDASMLQQLFEEATEVENLDFQPLDEVQALTPFRFFALIMQRPAPNHSDHPAVS